MEPLYGIDGNCQVRVRGQMSLSYPSRDSHLRKESASKEMQEQERIARKLPRSGLVQHYIRSNEGMEQTMGGFCIPASLSLRNALEESGYEDSRVVRGRFQNKGHAWVETQGKIIDITLDQFGGFPSVCISGVGDMRYSEVTDDDELKNMGLAGDSMDLTYSDHQGEECPLGTTCSVASELLDLYQHLRKGARGHDPTYPRC